MGCYGLLVDRLARPRLFNIMSCSYLCHPRKKLSQMLSVSAANLNSLVTSTIESKAMGESLKVVYKPLQSTQGTGIEPTVVAEGFQGCPAAQTDASDDDNGGVTSTSFTARRPFCDTCRKAQSLCICVRIKMIVNNKVGITILQHPEEKDHHLGTARIAALGLRNVQVLSIPETDERVSFRIRQKVPGSKRSITGRVGNKGKVKLEPQTAVVLTPDVQESEADHQQSCDPHLIPAWMNLPPRVGLLFPSDKAIDLVPELCEGMDCPSHFIVLDGTWSKAKRIYFENPWLHNLQHYNLPLSTPSMYGPVRRQPKEGCLSTVESIVCALKMLEPATVGLDSLLEVFNSMIEDAKGFQAQTELKYRRSGM
ncbi:uncharacterized protein [Physcomitrium patens]|uniref:tRNA-uridine aminocarboxypropyltransferase n=1 Tax=Physcomitrium patens TaxID=3218 RepID=A0A2K1KM92_PHYPA|nr:DTW domain-containing protein 2-like [Physcomitrium patens]XP_024374599.1 DTW domain-containing protein 2-like [Physcomitrium patens]XP_024374600.1 DTW domain-containing protein 2-like [Physcomitrium patens]PNR54886.1 hypothetical protein PHYPA_005779 [Physcomitrium patens]|eukprot:XP_024374598.1 DTW domain-containing protein 2-like [Physcomitrella patens]